MADAVDRRRPGPHHPPSFSSSCTSTPDVTSNKTTPRTNCINLPSFFANQRAKRKKGKQGNCSRVAYRRRRRPSMIPNHLFPPPSIQSSLSFVAWPPSRPQPKTQPASTQVPRGITHTHTHMIGSWSSVRPPACVRAMQQNTRVQSRADTTGDWKSAPLLQPIPPRLTGRLAHPPVRSLGRPTSPAGGVPGTAL